MFYANIRVYIGVFMRQLLNFLFIVVLASGCSSNKEVFEVRVPSSLNENDNLSLGQYVIGYIEKTGVGFIPYAGRIKSMESGIYEIDNEAPCSSVDCSVRVTKVFKEVKCMDGVCSGERAVDANGKEYEIRAVFSNGDVLADQGNLNFKSYLKSKDLFNECNCLGGACRYDMVVTPQGKKIEIVRIYRNGKVGVTSNKGEYTLKSLGYQSECTNETPCSCSLGKY
jgi:hypothetical protein